MEYVLALDQGSSSTRAIVFDERGRVAASSQKPVRIFRPEPGWAEHDPEELARSAEQTLDAALAGLPAKTQVSGMGLSSQRSTVVFWDRRTGKSLGRAPSWQDNRAAAVLAPMLDMQSDVHSRTGLYLTPYYSASKIRWMLDNEPKVRRAADAGRLCAGPVATWLLWRLSRGEIFATDPTLAQRTLLFDIRRMDWDAELLRMFSIPREILPSVRPSACSWGTLRRKGRTFPVLAVLGDQQAAAFGQGADSEGAGVLNYGTGAFFLLHTGRSDRRVPGLLTTVALQRESSRSFFLEGTVHACGAAFDWLSRLGFLSDVRKADKLCAASKERVWLLPAIGGLGTPRWDYRTAAACYGLSANTLSADVVRAAAESIAFLVTDAVATARAAGLDASAGFQASGGVARMDYLLQFQADLLQRPVSRLGEREATALGAASLAAETAKLPFARSLRESKPQKVFTPKITAEKARRLHSAWLFFVESQQKLGSRLPELLG
ncbi:MAG: FGGY family carbohydrate kinase [Elusimicrobiota bacterium]|jgi:glycerol kinase